MRTVCFASHHVGLVPPYKWFTLRGKWAIDLVVSLYWSSGITAHLLNGVVSVPTFDTAFDRWSSLVPHYLMQFIGITYRLGFCLGSFLVRCWVSAVNDRLQDHRQWNWSTCRCDALSCLTLSWLIFSCLILSKRKKTKLIVPYRSLSFDNVR